MGTSEAADRYPMGAKRKGMGSKGHGREGVDQHHSTVLNSGRAEMNSRLMGSLGELTDPSLCSAGAQDSSCTKV